MMNYSKESLFWLLVTGEVPSQEQVNALSAEWAARAGLPAHVEDMLNSLPSNVHPMSQFSAAVTLMNTQSKFAKVLSGFDDSYFMTHRNFRLTMKVPTNPPTGNTFTKIAWIALLISQLLLLLSTTTFTVTEPQPQLLIHPLIGLPTTAK